MNLTILKNLKYRLPLLICILITSCQIDHHNEGEKSLIKNEALITFSRLYGYVKYFHPTDEAASIDWDAFAIYGAEKVSSANNSSELKATLEELFLPVAPSLQILTENEEGKNSQLKWTNNGHALDTIAWQYKGLAFNTTHGYYKNQRLNRLDSIKPHRGNSLHYFKIDVIDLGKEKVSLSIRMKSKITSLSSYGIAGFYVRKQNGELYHVDKQVMLENGGWYNLSSEFIIPIGAVEIGLRFILVGSGSVFLDDFEVMLNDSGSLLVNEPFENDSLQNDGYSYESFNGLYAYNDNTSLYRSFSSKKEANSGTKSFCISSKSYPAEPYDFELPLSEINPILKRGIGSGLKISMPMLLPGDNNSTFPIANYEFLSGLKDSLSLVKPDINRVDTQQGIIISAWNALQHFNPHFKYIDVNWEDELNQALHRTSLDISRADIIKTLSLMCSPLKDGHMLVEDLMAKRLYYPPFDFKYINDSLVIEEVYNDSIDLKPGDLIVKIDDKNAIDLFNSTLKYNIKSTKASTHFNNRLELIRGQRNEQLHLKILRNDKIHGLTVTKNLHTGSFFSNYNINHEKLREINDDITYVNMTRMPYPEFQEKLSILKDREVLILDLRGYPTNVEGYIPHFLKTKDTVDYWLNIPKVVGPDGKFSGYYSEGWEYSPAPPYLTAKCYVLTDVRAVSYTESIIGFFEHYTSATLVGETTSAINGNVNRMYLPTGIRISWTGLEVVKHDGSRHFGIGFEPDVPVQRTIKGIREGRDEILEKAIELAKHHVDSLNNVN